MIDTPDVNSAYRLSSKEEIEALYEEWATSYDTAFGHAQGYQSPREVALAFVALGGAGPVLDVGAGTGLVAEFLTRVMIGPIDAIDLSAGMLDVARDKCVYRDLVVADVTQTLDAPLDRYNGVVSAGTFTLGHVGPEGLQPLLDVAAKGAVFALSIQKAHFETAGFEGALDALSDQITDLKLREFRIYDDRADDDHRDDIAFLLSFRKV